MEQADTFPMSGFKSLLQSLETVRSEIELAAFLRTLTKEFGFSNFMIADIPAATADNLQSHIGLSNLPYGFLETYDNRGFLKNSAVFAAIRRSTVPVAWQLDIADNRPPEEIETVKDLFRHYGITTGISFPVHAFDGRRAMIAFDGDRPPLSHLETSELGLLVIHAYDVFNNLRKPDPQLRQNLTARELEVLSWAANGKTSGEIAAILSLSDHTINTYMNSAMRKLDCVNRTQLVAKALRLHLIN